MSLTIESFTILEVYVYIPVVGRDHKCEFKREFRGFEVWLGDKFIRQALSFEEALDIAEDYIANLRVQIAPEPPKSWPPSP